MHYFQTATERQIKSAANKSRSLRNMMSTLNYACDHPGGNTMKRFKRVIGEDTYTEIASGKRYITPKSRWTKVPVNKGR